MGISTEERLGFNRRTFQVPNLMHALLLFVFTDKVKHCRPLYIVEIN